MPSDTTGPRTRDAALRELLAEQVRAARHTSRRSSTSSTTAAPTGREPSRLQSRIVTGLVAAAVVVASISALQLHVLSLHPTADPTTVGGSAQAPHPPTRSASDPVILARFTSAGWPEKHVYLVHPRGTALKVTFSCTHGNVMVVSTDDLKAVGRCDGRTHSSGTSKPSRAKVVFLTVGGDPRIRWTVTVFAADPHR